MENFKPHFLNPLILRSLFLSCFLFLSTFSVNSFASETFSDDACIYGICENPGEIGADQTIVRGNSPAELVETKRPTCEPGELEYLWLYYSASSGGWKPIPNSNSKTYQPHALFSTTYFLRCVRKKGCPTYVESNILRIAVVDCMPSGIEHEEACLGDPIKFYAQTVYSANDVSYRWTFEGGSPSTSNSQHVNVTWNSEGLKKVTLQVIDGQCENTYEEDVYVINCDCKGFYCRATSSANCGSGNARANGYGGAEPYSYRWSNGSTSRRIVGVPSGTYGLTVTDANGCVCSRYVTIEEPSKIRCSAYVKKNPSKCGSRDGVAVAQGIGGSGRYFYSWSNGQVGSIAFGLSAGTHSVVVTDVVSGCKTSCSVTLKDPVVACSVRTSNTSCGLNNGSATAIPTQGSGPFTYAWSNGGSSQTITGLAPGTYTATITDLRTRCRSVCSGTVGGSNSLTCTIDPSAATCNQANGGAVVTPAGGSGNYNYLWSNGATTSAVTGLAPGDYTAMVTDNSTGCTTMCSTTIESVNDDLDLELSVGCIVNNHNGGYTTLGLVGIGCQREVMATASGGSCAGTYSYSWSSGGSGSTSNVACGTTVMVTVSCGGCTVSKSIFVPEEIAITNIMDTDPDCDNGGTTGSISVAATGGVPPLTYCLIPTSGTDPSPSTCNSTGTFNNLNSGSYRVIVSDASGCTGDSKSTDDIRIDECCTLTCPDCFVLDEDQCECVPVPDIMLGEIGLVVTQIDCDNGGTTGSVTINATGGTPPLNYILNGGTPQASNTFNGLDPGTYNVRVTDGTGCSEVDAFGSFTIDECPAVCPDGREIECEELVVDQVFCCDDLPQRNPGNTVIFCTNNNDNGTWDLEFSNCNSIEGRCPIRLPIYNGTGPVDSEDSYNCDAYNNGSRLMDPVSDGQIKKAYEIVDQLNKQTQEEGSTNEVALDIINTQVIPTAKIFPNPFHDNVNIVLSDYSAFAKSLHIEVINITGQVIQRQVVDAAAATYELNLGNQATGIYIVRISGEGIKPEIHKVVKN